MSDENVPVIDGTTVAVIFGVVTGLLGAWAWMESNTRFHLPEQIVVSFAGTWEIPVVAVLPTIGALVTLFLARRHIAARVSKLFGGEESEPDGAKGSDDRKGADTGRGSAGSGNARSEDDSSDTPSQKGSTEAHPDAPTSSCGIPEFENDQGDDTGNGSDGRVNPSFDIDGTDVERRGPSPHEHSGTVGGDPDGNERGSAVSSAGTSEADRKPVGTTREGRESAAPDRSGSFAGDGDKSNSDSAPSSSENTDETTEAADETEDDTDADTGADESVEERTPANPVTERDIARYGDRDSAL